MKIYLPFVLAALLVGAGILSLTYAQGPAPPGTSEDPANGLPAAAPAPPPGSSPYRLPPGTRYQTTPDGQSVVVVSPDGKIISTHRSGIYSRGLSGGLQLNDPEAAKLYAAEEEAAKEAHELVAKLRKATEEKEKTAAMAELKAALSKQFEAQQKRRALEVSKIEERLGKLKDTMKKRESAKDTIVGRRLDELTGVTDELGWEESGFESRIAPGNAPVSIPYPTLPAPNTSTVPRTR